MVPIRGITRALLLTGLSVLLAALFFLNPANFAQLTPALASAPADEAATPQPVTPQEFTADLVGAIVSRNQAALEAMMGSPFVWANWSGAGEAMEPQTAVARLESELLVATSRGVTFVAPIVIDEWLRGIDALSIWPPDVQPVSAIGLGGLGESGADEAILVIAQDADGAYYWYGLLSAVGGFSAQEGDPPTTILVAGELPVTIIPSDVEQVLVLGTVGIFDGPGSQYSQVGTAERGQTFPVLGASADGQWWAITCPQLSGACWISANPTFVRPLIVLKPSPTRTPAPVRPTATPTRTPVYPTPRPTSTSAPQQPERIQFAPGQDRAVRSGPLWANTLQQYVFRAAAGQFATIRFNSPSPAASFGIVGVSDGLVYKAQGDMRRDFTFQVPVTQDYLISLLAPVNTSFTLELIIPRSGPTPVPTVQPAPERISFAPGQISAVRSGVLPDGVAKQYIFKAMAGQLTTILLTGPFGSSVNFSLRGASDGLIYKSSNDPSREWTSTLPRTQDYLITLFASGETAYTLELTILPVGPTPTGVPTTAPTAVPSPAERITFAPGQDAAVRSGPLAANQYKRYVFGGLEGQTATIVLSSPSPSAYFTVVGVSDGIPYKSQGSSALSFTFTLPMTQDYLISIAASVNTSYSLVLTIPPLAGPTPLPTLLPTLEPTAVPTLLPTLEPTVEPTLLPTLEPTVEPTLEPTVEPTLEPTPMPTLAPTPLPTLEPTIEPTLEPTAEPTVEMPTPGPVPIEPGSGG